MFSKPTPTYRKTISLLAILIAAMSFSSVIAQQDTGKKESSILETIPDESTPQSILTLDDPTELTKAVQEKIVAEVYELAKKSKTASELTEVIETCKKHVNQKFNKENLEYLNSVIAWGLHKRGEKRMELAADLREAGNIEQSTTILVSAVKDLDQSLATDPNRWRATMSRGMANVSRSEFGMAIDDFSDVVKSQPSNVNALFNRAEVYYAMEQHELAVADYDRVLKLDKNDIQAMTGRAHANLRLGNIEQALADYTRVIQYQPENAIARINRGDLYQSQRDWKNAFEDFRAAVDLNGGGVAFQRTAWLLATCPTSEFSRPSESLDMITKAISMDGQTVINLETLAAAYASIGEFEQARSTQQKALESAATANEEMKVRMASYEAGKPYLQSEPDTKIR